MFVFFFSQVVCVLDITWRERKIAESWLAASKSGSRAVLRTSEECFVEDKGGGEQGPWRGRWRFWWGARRGGVRVGRGYRYRYFSRGREARLVRLRARGTGQVGGDVAIMDP